MVLPDFQKKGFGTVLTHHCNAIADKTGDKTFVTARPTSKTMFEASGFKVLGIHDYQLERWGGDPAWNNHYVLVREPSS
jgi:N-acetylglutamate synthase-like GNAT family acetyltransferase